MVYAFAFCVSSALFCIGTKRIKAQLTSRVYLQLGSFCYFVGILLLASLAGIRSNNIGDDVNSYILYAFQRALSYASIKEVFTKGLLEPGYELLCYICSRIYPDIHILHFVTAFIICSGVYLFAKEYVTKIDVAFAMFIFMMLYFNTSLNIVRQFLSIAVYLFGCKYLFRHKYSLYFFCCLIAISFHSSGIISVFVGVLYIFLADGKRKKLKIMTVVVGSILSVVCLRHITALLSSFSIIPSKYLKYFSVEGNSSVFIQIVSRAPVLFLCVFFLRDLLFYDEKSHIYFCFLLIDCIIGASSPLIGDASRFSLYFGVWQMILIPEIVRVAKYRFKDGGIKFKLGLVAFFSLYWIYCVVIRNFGGTFPFETDVFF